MTRSKQLLQIAAACACGLAAMATQPPRMVRNYPAWEIGTPDLRLRHAHLSAWVSKSGKTGMGLTLQVKNLSQRGLSVAVASAELRVHRAVTVYAPPQPPQTMAVDATLHFYLPFGFDNERLWNEGRYRAELHLVLRIDGQDVPWRLSAAHLLKGGYHRRVSRDYWNRQRGERRLQPGHPDEPATAPSNPRSAPASAPASRPSGANEVQR